MANGGHRPLYGDMHRGFVYFVRSRKTGLTRIGSTRNIYTRFHGLESLYGRLSIVALIPANKPLTSERKWHRKFQDKRVGGEWFKLTIAEVFARTGLTKQVGWHLPWTGQSYLQKGEPNARTHRIPERNRASRN